MRLLADAVLRDQYDVVVVGAGLGGLTAASLLAKRGLSVLVIEQQDKPGGSCTSFKREDVVFDVGTAMLYGFGERGFKPFRFVLNELEEPVEIVAHPTLARMTLEGRPLIFWPDLERFMEELDELFPEEKAGIRAFYADLYKMYENIVLKNEVIVPPSEFSSRQALRSLLINPVAMLKMQRLLSTSTRELLDRYFHTEAIIDFYDMLCSAYCYCTAEETPAVLAATMFLDNHIGGVYYPAGGAQMLPNKMERALERYGGRMLYRRLVDEILIEEGTAYGVRLEDGTEITAERVIANATVWNIYGKLVRPEHIRPERLAWAQALVPTYPSMVLYMVVDSGAVPADAMPWEIFIEQAEGIDSSDLTLYINSLVDRTLCPPGKLVITAIAPNMRPWPAPHDPAYRSAEYQAQKEREAERMIDQIEAHYPGFRRRLQTLIVGTPTTIERYLLKNGGAVGGPKNALGQQMLKRLHARSEWKNLYFCGDSTVMATGAPATVVSGVGAANMVLRDLRRREYERRSFKQHYIRFVDLPYRRPACRPGEAISAANAWLVAAECQWCQSPACVADCPAGVDVPGFLRRMEAQNYGGAARRIRELNPLGEVCGHTCAADPACQHDCCRLSFADRPVRIAELQRWVCAEAGDAGWPPAPEDASGPPVAVVGSGPAGLSCAYYLALAGCPVDLHDEGERPTDRLLGTWGTDAPAAAIERDVRGLLLKNIHYQGGHMPDSVELARRYAAVYLSPGSADLVEAAAGVYVCDEGQGEELSVVAGAAAGRRAALAILQQLG
jgi:prolycopene isomerase